MTNAQSKNVILLADGFAHVEHYLTHSHLVVDPERVREIKTGLFSEYYTPTPTAEQLMEDIFGDMIKYHDQTYNSATANSHPDSNRSSK